MTCYQELCEYWSGDGKVCPCALFGINPDSTDDPEEDR